MSKYVTHGQDDTDDSSLFHAKIRVEDLEPQEALQNVQSTVEELEKEEFLKEAQNISLEGELDDEVYKALASLLDEVELSKEASDMFTMYEEILKGIYSFLENALSHIMAPFDKMRKEKEWLFSLLRKCLNKSLSWEEMLNNEIAELKEKLENNELTTEERSELMKRLKVLQEIQLYKFTAIGLLIGIVANFIGLTSAVGKSAEIVRNATEKLSKIQEVDQKRFERSTEIESLKPQEQEERKTYNELRESIFKELAKNQITPPLLLNVIKPATDLLNHVNDLAYKALEGKIKEQQTDVKVEKTENKEAKQEKIDTHVEAKNNGDGERKKARKNSCDGSKYQVHEVNDNALNNNIEIKSTIDSSPRTSVQDMRIEQQQSNVQSISR